MNQTRVLLASLFVAAPAWTLAQAGPPMITDDPGTPGTNHWEINVVYMNERDAGGGHYDFPYFDINYGCGERVQFKFEGSAHQWFYNGAERGQGIGDNIAGVKWRFYDKGEGKLQMSTYPQYFFSPVPSLESQGVESGVTGFYAPIEITDTFNEIELGAEFGYMFQRPGPNTLNWGLVVGKQFTKMLELMAEIHYDQGAGYTQGLWNIGTRITLTPTRIIVASIGEGLPGTGPDRPQAILYLGLQILK